MKRIMTIATASVAALLVAFTIGVAAQDFNPQEKTFMTFSGPVEMPGVTLQAGTYVFRLADTPSRNVVQVLSQDEKNVLGQWLFVQAERPQVTGDTVVTFKETREGTTPAVQYWYYPGEKIGKEFIYPKDQALKIAQRTGATVKTDDGDVSASATASASVPAESTAVESSASASVDNAPGPGANDQNVVNGSGVPAETTIAESQNAEPAPAATSGISSDSRAVGTSGRDEQAAADANANYPRQESTTARNELPRTASPLPLSGLLGLFSLFGAATVRRFRG
jgi:hypothetical protein